MKRVRSKGGPEHRVAARSRGSSTGSSGHPPARPCSGRRSAKASNSCTRPYTFWPIPSVKRGPRSGGASTACWPRCSAIEIGWKASVKPSPTSARRRAANGRGCSRLPTGRTYRAPTTPLSNCSAPRATTSGAPPDPRRPRPARCCGERCGRWPAFGPEPGRLLDTTSAGSIGYGGRSYANPSIQEASADRTHALSRRSRRLSQRPRTTGATAESAALAFLLGQTHCRGSPGSSRSRLPRAGDPVSHDGGDPTRRSPAGRETSASNLAHSCGPFRPVAFPKERLSAARIGYLSTQPGSRSVAARLSGVAGATAEMARSPSRDHQGEVDEP